MRKRRWFMTGLHGGFIVLCLFFVLPMVMVLSISLSSERAITAANAGYSLLPREISLEAYRLAFRNAHAVGQAYLVTAGQAFLGTFLTLVICGMAAYPLSRSHFAYRKSITFFIFFTMLFSGGMIPTYVVYTKYYHLGDTFWIYILPYITGGAMNTLILRTFFRNLPESLFESAKIDGGRELRIFLSIAVPLSTPALATIGFITLVDKWNDWYTSLLYIFNSDLVTLQYLLQRILNQERFLSDMLMNNVGTGVDPTQIKHPVETLRYAMCVIAAGPMLLMFPFFQKYFSQGLTIGAVKG